MKVKLVIAFVFANVCFGWNLSGFFKPAEKAALKESYGVGEIAVRSSSKNIDEILQYAVEKGRISGVDKYKLHTLYSWNNGGVFLAKCFKVKGCNPYEFYKKVYNQPPLYKHIYLKYPTLSVEQLRLKVGKVNEIIMDKYFTKSSWKKIEGEIGRNGVDGLYVKYNKKGNIIDVMLVEAKYGKAQLNRNTNQMSKEWSLTRIDKLIKKYPNNLEYKIIKKRIEKGNYRARLWKMKEENGKLVIDLKKIKSNSNDVTVESLRGGEKTKINYKDNFIIDLNNPKSSFHKEVAKWYKEAIDEI